LPLTLLIALAVRLTSPGPILYSQERVGRDRRGPRQGTRNGQGGPDIGRREHDAGGQIFTMYKFRTMKSGVKGSASREVWASPADRRITPVGSVLRAYRLDELPQLLNVLRGEMNVVGPRPEQPAIFQELRGQVERYPERQTVLPGITGWAQVNQSYDQSLDDVRRKVEFDLEYILRRSPVEDLRIMARTLPVMVGRKGAL
jgi:lipopolysaccharide/colanic/teichoic acid biosynthesis glycosyltransferase